MKIKYLLLLAAALSLISSRPAPAAADPKIPTPTMPSAQVLPGMKGYGLTVMSGTEPKQFGVEIIGILKKANSGGDIFLGRMIGEDVEHTGPAAGMSGSPIFIDGKMIGALAWAWSLSKDPICGITPVDDMLTIKANKAVETADSGATPEPPAFRSAAAAAAGLPQPQAANGPAPSAPSVRFDLPSIGSGELRPIATPVSASGFTESSRVLLQRLFESRFASPVTIAGGVSGGAGDYAPDPSADELRPGSVLTVPLMWGDFELAVLGTVSYRDGDTILAFGHPMFNNGPLTMPMAGGRVHHVMANIANSFKMGDPGRVVGSVDFDGAFAIRGRIGGTAPVSPAKITIADIDAGATYTFNVTVARRRDLTSRLIGIAAGNAISKVIGDSGDGMVDIAVSAKFTGAGNPLEYTDTFYTDPVAFADPMTYVSEMMANPYKRLELESCDIKMTVRRGRRTARVAAVGAAAGKIVPGDTFKAFVDLKNFDGTSETVPFDITLPKDAPAGAYKLFASGGLGYSLRDVAPDTFEQLFKDAGERAKYNSLIVVLIYPEKNPAIRGEVLNNTPSTISGAFLSGGYSGITPVDRNDKIVIPRDRMITEQAVTIFTVDKK